MEQKINQIIEAWDRSCSEDRETFLRELHKRYGFERLCLALSIVTHCDLRNKFGYKENEQRSQVLSNGVEPRV